MEDQVQTKGSKLMKDYDFKAVVFSSRRKPNDQLSNTNKDRRTEPNERIQEELDIKKITKEVIKFGASGFYQRRREKTLKSLAVELGAKPEKKRYHNYKELKEIRKQNRLRREERVKALNLSANRFKKPAKKRSKKSDVSILNKYGKRR